MNNLLKVAVMLTAYDQMSRTINDAVNKSKSKLDDLKRHSTQLFAQGAGLMGIGQEGLNYIGTTVKAFGDLEEASLSLKSVMMKDGGILDIKQFEAVNKLAETLGNKLPGTTEDFNKMFATMIKSGSNAQDIIDGLGKSASYLSVAIGLPYEQAGELAVKLQNATGVANKDMIAFMDVIARTNNVGVKSDEMAYAFARSAGAMKLLKLQGLEAAKSVSIVNAMLIKSGQSGETVGTGMTSIYNSITNVDKMNAFNAALSKYGINAEFVDKKTGNFKGIENMIMQFEKIRKLGLGVEEQGALTRILLGPGADANFMNILVSEGVAGFEQMTKKMAEQASLNDKVDSQLKGLNSRYEAATGTFTNLLATMGSALAPSLGRMLVIVNEILGSMIGFFQENPKFAKFIMLMASFVSVGFMAAGLIKIFQGIRIAMMALNLTMAMNPYVLAAMAIIAIVAAVVIWRKEIREFFGSGIIGKIAMFAAALVAPWVLVIVYWDDIMKFLKSLPGKISGLAGVMYRAGANILKSVWAGMKSMAHKPVEVISDMTKKMRDYLPFSPAKQGAFRDLHKIKIVETIAATLKPGGLVRAMSNLTSSAGGAGAISLAGAGGSGTVQINYSPVIHIGSGSESDKNSFAAMLKEHEVELMRFFTEANRKNNRGKF